MAQASSLVQFLIVVLAAWLARQQDAFIEYLKAENRVLKARLGRRRVIFSDAERRRGVLAYGGGGHAQCVRARTDRLARLAAAVASSADRDEVDVCAKPARAAAHDEGD